MARVFDCFTYFNEDRLLDLRLRTLSAVVDVFVIVEATRTFTGKPKKLNFDPDRYPAFRDRIRYVIVDDLPRVDGDPWANEVFQRNAILRGLDDACEQDRVIIADVDEIPHPDAIGRYDPRHVCGTFRQRFFGYQLNNLGVQANDPERERTWILCRITTAAHLRRFWRTPQRLRLPPLPHTLSDRFRELRRRLGQQWLSPGGWHFTWAMHPEQMILKMESYSHTETNRAELKSCSAIEEKVRAGQDILDKGERFRRIRIDETFPEPLRTDPAAWADLIVEVE